VQSADSAFTKTVSDIGSALAKVFAPDTTNTRVETLASLLPSFTDSGLYGAASVRLSNLGGGVGTFVGGYGGWLFDKTLMIGGGGFAMVNPGTAAITEQFPSGAMLEGMSYGGLMAEYTFNPEKVLHYSTQLFAGIGGVTVGDAFAVNPVGRSATQTIFVIEPAAFIEMSLTKTLRASFGASYRVVLGKPLTAANGGTVNLSGIALIFNLKFGKF
jgi:hypothetical protein